jgi:hypothetical protein
MSTFQSSQVVLLFFWKTGGSGILIRAFLDLDSYSYVCVVLVWYRQV